MKRLAAIALAFLFAWLLFIPFFATSSVSNLPACCRKTGKHHCTVSESNQQTSSLQEKCSYSGHLPVSAFPDNYVLSGEAAFVCYRYAGSNLTTAELAGAPTFFKNASQQRGPPSLPLS